MNLTAGMGSLFKCKMIQKNAIYMLSLFHYLPQAFALFSILLSSALITLRVCVLPFYTAERGGIVADTFADPPSGISI
jgi:hypothetical protein